MILARVNGSLVLPNRTKTRFSFFSGRFWKKKRSVVSQRVLLPTALYPPNASDVIIKTSMEINWSCTFTYHSHLLVTKKKMGDCDTEQAIYWVFVVISLLLTLVLAIYRAKERNFVNNPKRGMKIFCTVGVIKIILGTLLLTVLYPVDCYEFDVTYGALTIMFGLYWLVLGAAINNPIVDIRSTEMQPMDTIPEENGKDVEAPGIFSW